MLERRSEMCGIVSKQILSYFLSHFVSGDFKSTCALAMGDRLLEVEVGSQLRLLLYLFLSCQRRLIFPPTNDSARGCVMENNYVPRHCAKLLASMVLQALQA